MDENLLVMKIDAMVLPIVIEQQEAEHHNEVRSKGSFLSVVREIKSEDLSVDGVQDGKLRLGLTDWPIDLA